MSIAIIQSGITSSQPPLQWLLLTAGFLGLITGFIAKSKGRSFAGYWAFGFLMFIVALPWVLLMKKTQNAEYKQQL
jgi:apolipoprotein N-acyltransferase